MLSKQGDLLEQTKTSRQRDTIPPTPMGRLVVVSVIKERRWGSHCQLGRVEQHVLGMDTACPGQRGENENTMKSTAAPPCPPPRPPPREEGFARSVRGLFP